MNEETLNQPTVPNSGDYLQQSKTHALQAAEELRAAADQLRDAAAAGASRLKDSAVETTKHLKESATTQAVRAREIAGRRWDSARTHAREWHNSGEHFIRENPTKSVLAALGVGFVLGLIFRR